MSISSLDPNNPDNLFLKTVPFTKFLVLLYLCYQYSILIIIPTFFIFQQVYIYFMFKCFNLIPHTLGDKTFLHGTKEDTYNCGIILKFKQLDIPKLKNVILEKGIQNAHRLRLIRQVKFLETWWRQLSVEEAKERLIFIEDRETCINNENDLALYMKNMLNKDFFDVHNELPYKFIFITGGKDEKSEKYVICHLDHCVSDGLGVLSFLCAMAENYTPTIFPQMRKPGLFDTIFMYLYFPFGFISFVYNTVILGYYQLKKTPFKLYTNLSGECDISISKNFDFNEFVKINKKMKVTFNDLISSIISASFNKILKTKYPQYSHLKYLSALYPIGYRAPPNSIKDIDMDIASPGSGVLLELIEDPLISYKKVSKSIGKLTRHAPIVSLIIKLITGFFHTFMPRYLTKPFFMGESMKSDLLISNIPGPRGPLIWAGCEVEEMLPTTTCGFHPIFIPVISYNGKFKLSCTVDRSLGIEEGLILKTIQKEIERVIEIGSSDDKKKE